jgi:hypothetical protein
VADVFLVRPCDTAYKVSKDSLDSQALLQQRRQAPPVGRALRILPGVVLIVYVTPVYFQAPVRVTVGSLLLILGLTAAYTLIHIGVSRRIVSFGPCLGAVVAAGLLVALYIVGASQFPILGRARTNRGQSSNLDRLAAACEGDSYCPMFAHEVKVAVRLNDHFNPNLKARVTSRGSVALNQVRQGPPRATLLSCHCPERY